MRERLDLRLVALGLAPSREKAQRLVLAGTVRVNSQPAAKPSQTVRETDHVELTLPERFVSRGGYKLEAALNTFALNCTGRICADIGASTGGFTDCLLQHGAAKVHAVDVGKGQLDWKLRQNPRVVVHDGVNARYLTAETLGELVDVATVDVSFISLMKVLPAVVALVKPHGWIVALIKPQYEAGKKDVQKGGVVRDSAVHERVKTAITTFVTDSLRLRVSGVLDSPLLGPAGNKEFLIAMEKP